MTSNFSLTPVGWRCCDVLGGGGEEGSLEGLWGFGGVERLGGLGGEGVGNMFADWFLSIFFYKFVCFNFWFL